MTAMQSCLLKSAPLLSLLLLALSAGCHGRCDCGAGMSPEAMIFPEKDWTIATPESQGLDSARLASAMAVIDEIAEDHKNGTKSAGNTQVVLVRNGRIVWQGNDIDNLHRIHSCSKSIMSITFGLLYDDGLVAPDTLATDIQPEMKQYYPEVTLGQMANFTSGYNVPWRQSPLELRPPLHAPGAAFHYSSSSNQLSKLLTMAGRTPLKDLLRERICEPIGIPDEAWDWDSVGEVDGMAIYGGAGQVSMTARQLARIGLLMLNEGNWNGRQLLSREWVNMSTRPQVDPSVPPYQSNGWYVHLPGRYGYNWWVNGVDTEGRLYWPNATAGTFVAQGNNNNHCFIIPEWNMVLVRTGNDKPIDSQLYDKVFVELRKAFIDGTVAP